MHVVTVKMTDDDIKELSPDGMIALLALTCTRLGMINGTASLCTAAKLAKRISNTRLVYGDRHADLEVDLHDPMAHAMLTVARVLFGVLLRIVQCVNFRLRVKLFGPAVCTSTRFGLAMCAHRAIWAAAATLIRVILLEPLYVTSPKPTLACSCLARRPGVATCATAGHCCD